MQAELTRRRKRTQEKIETEGQVAVLGSTLAQVSTHVTNSSDAPMNLREYNNGDGRNRASAPTAEQATSCVRVVHIETNLSAVHDGRWYAGEENT